MEHDPTWFYFPADSGLLRFSDPDRAAFLQRQTTNDVRLLAPGRAVTTVVTSPMGRILDVMQLMALEEAIEAVTLPHHAGATFDFFRRRIFFNDRVKIADVSAEFCQALLDGPGAPGLLEAAGLAAPGLEGLGAGEIGGIPVRVLGQPGLDGVGYRIVGPASKGEELRGALAGLGARELDEAEYHLRRVEAGLPAEGAELVEEYTPLEARLNYAISTTKGCYTGQEVIARQITYDKITRLLVGLRLSMKAAPGMHLSAEGKPAGEITSYAFSPRLGHLALAVVKRPNFEPGSTVMVEGEALAQVSLLPFPT